MDIRAQIERKLMDTFAPERLRIDNDSSRHAGPATDSHYRVVIVSDAFTGENSLKRQRAVYACLAEEMSGPIHALQMKCMTPDEYQAADGDATLNAPPCRGGSRRKA